MVDYVFIVCRSHSGSTLLEKLLGTADDVVCLCEVSHFSSYTDAPDKPCGCGETVADCAFWTRIRRGVGLPQGVPVDSIFPTDGYRDERRLPNAAYLAALAFAPALLAAQRLLPGSVAARNHAALRNHFRLVREVADRTGARVLVDKSMSASRLLEIARDLPGWLRLSAVHVTRDGRANAYSHMTRFGTDIDAAARGWKRDNRHAMLALSRLSTVPQARLRYEDLCRDPRGALDDLADRLGLRGDFDPARLGNVQHTIGGNPNKLTGYDQIQFDDRFRQALSPDQLTRFDAIAGRLNRALGYG
ncbi:MAG: sulfotransferase [Myxococcales bacterium]